MIEILALVGAILLIVQVQQLRAVLALPLPRRRFHVLSGPPDDIDELFAELQAQAEALGFSGPTWVHSARADGEPETSPYAAVYRAPDGVGQLWLLPPANVAQPNRLLTYFCHRFANGCTAISQPFDPYFTLLQGDDLVARTAGEPELAAQWLAHSRWVATLGGEPLTISDAELGHDTELFFERLRQRLLITGKARAITDDLALPRLPLAISAMRAMRKTPKPPADPRPVPPARMARLALLQEMVSHRSPPRDVQWGLFALSVVLFMALGALFWSLELAIAILVVVVVHELGHFLAMRAFGYRNVHILALPLVGGVAMGHDVNPGASKRAWMSLMGPLPGIVIGWALLAAIFLGGNGNSLLLTLAGVFLFINYLNVLPVPPLDGAHVLEALLPVRWARLQTVVIGLAAVIGAVLAWHFELYILMALALLQLPALKGQWRLHGIERALADESGFAGQTREQKLLRILTVLEATLGRTSLAAQRIGEALRVLQRLELQPMGVPARLATSLVYLSLLAVPVVGLVGYGLMQDEGDDPASVLADHEAARAALQKQAAQLPLATLLTELTGEEDGALPPPASAEALAAAEARLGRTLPADLRAFYEVANGLPSANLQPVDNIGAHPPGMAELLSFNSGKLPLETSAGEWVELDAVEMRDWWYLGGEDDAPLFYLPEPHPRLPGTRVLSYFIEAPSLHPGLRDYLDMHWIEHKQSVAWIAAQSAAEARNTQALADTPVEELLQEWPEPHFLASWMMPEYDTPDGADEATLSDAEKRLGLRLPAELRRVLATHDGFPPLQLLPAAQVTRWRDQAATIRDLPADGPTVAHCLIVAGRIADPANKAPTYPRLLWCPDGQPAAWYDLADRSSHASLRDWLLPQAARIAPAVGAAE